MRSAKQVALLVAIASLGAAVSALTDKCSRSIRGLDPSSRACWPRFSTRRWTCGPAQFRILRLSAAGDTLSKSPRLRMLPQPQNTTKMAVGWQMRIRSGEATTSKEEGSQSCKGPI